MATITFPHKMKSWLRSAMKNDKQKGDICLFRHKATNTICWNDREDWQIQMKSFRNARKDGFLKILEKNNQTVHIRGRPMYILVIHQDDNIDTFGFGFDTPLFVDGFIYAFLKKENRDASYKYIMGIK